MPTDDKRRRQTTDASEIKQYWPIRRASNNVAHGPTHESSVSASKLMYIRCIFRGIRLSKVSNSWNDVINIDWEWTYLTAAHAPLYLRTLRRYRFYYLLLLSSIVIMSLYCRRPAVSTLSSYTWLRITEPSISCAMRFPWIHDRSYRYVNVSALTIC